jgi:BMFP domain-containing protein YqiC
MKETHFKANIVKYLEKIDEVQRESFAPIDKLIEKSLEGYDLHILVLKNLSDL